MANLIDISFFVGDRIIPNRDDSDIADRLNWFIDKYEPECLNGILGYELYKLLTTEVSSRITDLKDGKEYTNLYGKLDKWEGLVNEVDQSLIADYVYSIILSDNTSQNTGIAVLIPKGQQAINISPADKICNSWNSFSHHVRNMVRFLKSSSSLYTEFDSCQESKTLRFSSPINTFDL